MNGGDIDFAKLKEQSEEMDGQKGENFSFLTSITLCSQKCKEE